MRRPLRRARWRASGPPTPCRAKRAETPETPAAAPAPATGARAATPPSGMIRRKPSAAGFAPPEAPAEPVLEVDETFIGMRLLGPRYSGPQFSALVNGGLREVYGGEPRLSLSF